ISSWDADIELVKGSKNVEADALSRNPVTPLAGEETWFEESPEEVYAPIASLFETRISASTLIEEQRKDGLCTEITKKVEETDSKESRGYRIIDGILKKKIRYKLIPKKVENVDNIKSMEDLPIAVAMTLIGQVAEVLGSKEVIRDKKEEGPRKDSSQKRARNGKTRTVHPSTAERTSEKEKKSESNRIKAGGNRIKTFTLTQKAKTYGEYFVPVIPESLQAEIMYMFHDSTYAGHLSATATARKIKEKAYWNHMDKAIRDYCRECKICQETKSTNHLPYGLLQPVQPPSRIMEVLHVDILGPLPKSGGSRQNEYLFVVVDTLSKWVELFPIRSATAKKLIDILEDEIFCRYGVPSLLVSDCGSQFISRLFEETLRRWGINHRFTAPYHHQANQSERVNRTIVQILRAYVADNHREWDVNIQKFAFALRTTVHETTKCTPALLQLGREIPTAFDRDVCKSSESNTEAFLESIRSLPEDLKNHIEWVKENIKNMQKTNKVYYDRRHIPHPFKTGDKVMVKNHSRSDKAAHKIQKLLRKWIGPFLLGEKADDNDNTFEILTIPEGKAVGRREVKDLKPFVQRKTVKRKLVVSPRVEDIDNTIEPNEDSEEPAQTSRRVKERLDYRALAGHKSRRRAASCPKK
ncbi:unnamed protein product, partial [Orchesella dallaii]